MMWPVASALRLGPGNRMGTWPCSHLPFPGFPRWGLQWPEVTAKPASRSLAPHHLTRERPGPKGRPYHAGPVQALPLNLGGGHRRPCGRGGSGPGGLPRSGAGAGTWNVGWDAREVGRVWGESRRTPGLTTTRPVNSCPGGHTGVLGGRLGPSAHLREGLGLSEGRREEGDDSWRSRLGAPQARTGPGCWWKARCRSWRLRTWSPSRG